MKFKLGLLILICVGISSFDIPESVEKRADKEIRKFYDIESFEKKYIEVSTSANAETPAEFGNENFFRISSEDGFLGYGYIGNAPSKTATFDYLVLFDKNYIITKSKVLIYREEYGGEIGSKRWLKQFNGASIASGNLVYNEDIIPISGATISVKSMTKAINELMSSLKKLQELNNL